jgi:hypothetical protein
MAWMITWKHCGCSEPVTQITGSASFAEAVLEHLRAKHPLNNGDNILFAKEISAPEAVEIGNARGFKG